MFGSETLKLSVMGLLYQQICSSSEETLSC